MSLALGAIGQIHISVTDVERSVAFYRDVLGRGAVSMAKPQKVHEDGTISLHMAFVADPDGNPVGLMEERPI